MTHGETETVSAHGDTPPRTSARERDARARFAHDSAQTLAQLAFQKRIRTYTMADPETDVKYAAAGTAAVQLVSLGTDPKGPLRVSPHFILCQLIGGYDERAAHAELGMNALEFVCFDKLKFDEQLDAETKEWHVSPPRWTRYWRSLKTAGMPTACVGSIEAARTLVLGYTEKLAIAERTIEWADAHVEAAATINWMGKVSAAKVRQTDTTNTVYVQMRNLCSGLWTTQGRSLDHYKEMIDDIVTERVNTGSASLNRQAAAVIEWFRSTRMSGSLIHFIDVDEGPVELQRRLGETDSDRFRPLFEARWSQAYPTLTKLFDKSTGGGTGDGIRADSNRDAFGWAPAHAE